MGLSAFQGLSENLQSIPDSAPQRITLPAASRGENWRELTNMRLTADKGYPHLFTRGGSELKKTLFGNILTMKGFDARIDGEIKSFFAAHTTAGKAYLWQVGSADPANEFIASGLSADSQVIFMVTGQILYVFDPAGEVYKFHDISRDETYDWLNHQSCNLTGYSWLSRDWREENIFGFKKGGRALLLHNYEGGSYQDPVTGLPSLRSFIARIDRVKETSFTYRAPGDESFQTSDGVIGAAPATPDLKDYEGISSSFIFTENQAVGYVEVLSNGGGDTRFSIHVGSVKIPETGFITAPNADSITQVAMNIQSAMSLNTELMREFNVTRSGAIITLQAKAPGQLYAGRAVSVEYYDDPQSTVISTNDTGLVSYPLTNPNYTEPVLWKGYLIVDLLPDGSVSMPGRPLLAKTTMRDIITGNQAGIELTFAGAPPVVRKRYVYATRWQTGPGNVFTPSRPEYDNSAFFFVKEVNPTQTTFRDFTSDGRLISPLSGRLPMSAGIPEIFGKGQISPTSAAITRGTLAIGGYRIDRPLPGTYTQASNPDRKNVFVDVSVGTDLAESLEIGLLFEYTDGTKSNLHESGLLLTDGEAVIVEAYAGDEAFTEFYLTNDPDVDGAITIYYPSEAADEEIVTANYLAADTRVDVANKIRDAINGDGDIQLTATTLTPEPGVIGLRVTEKRVGSQHNGAVAKMDYPADGELKYESLSGGTEPITQETESANKMILHSLNGLVSKVYVLLKDGTDWRLSLEVGTEDPEFLGMPVRLPNAYADVQDFPVFTLPGSDQTLESVELYDHMVTGVPPQQILISEQASIADASRIESILITRFDSDKTQMRLQMLIFTDQNLQTGYYVFGAQGVEKDFEVARHGFRLRHPFGAFMVDNTPIAQTERGIYSLGQGGGLLIDSRDYPIVKEPLTGCSWRDKWGEIWFTFYDSLVLAMAPDAGIRTFHYPLGAITTCFEHGGNMAIGHGADLYFTDIQDVLTDGGSDYEGILETRGISDPAMQVKILEVTAFGQDLSGAVDVDPQRSRKEGNGSVWEHDFFPDYQGSEKPLTMAGASWTPHIRGIAPRLRLRVSPGVDGFVSGLQINHITLENRGKAR